MKKLIVILIAGFIGIQCKKHEPNHTAKVEKQDRTFPASIAAIFNAHGTYNAWDKMETLKYTIASDKGNQTHTVDLKSRKIIQETPQYLLGFDGKKVWLKQDSTYFNPKRARFMHNLMFYFYAMPFVLGDAGITYTDVEALNFEGKLYPGIKISFGAGIGDAPEDNYIIYSDPLTHQMAFLAYTVTYGKNKASNKYSLIRYNDWQEVNGIKLPKKLEWHEFTSNTTVGKKRYERIFTDVELSSKMLPEGYFEKPNNAVYTE